MNDQERILTMLQVVENNRNNAKLYRKLIVDLEKMATALMRSSGFGVFQPIVQEKILHEIDFVNKRIDSLLQEMLGMPDDEKPLINSTYLDAKSYLTRLHDSVDRHNKYIKNLGALTEQNINRK